MDPFLAPLFSDFLVSEAPKRNFFLRNSAFSCSRQILSRQLGMLLHPDQEEKKTLIKLLVPDSLTKIFPSSSSFFCRQEIEIKSCFWTCALFFFIWRTLGHRKTGVNHGWLQTSIRGISLSSFCFLGSIQLHIRPVF